LDGPKRVSVSYGFVFLWGRGGAPLHPSADQPDWRPSVSVVGKPPEVLAELHLFRMHFK
jgi:hypothetical protein